MNCRFVALVAAGLLVFGASQATASGYLAGAPRAASTDESLEGTLFPSSVSPRERVWIGKATSWSKSMASALNGLGNMLSSPTKQRKLLAGDTDTQLQAAVYLVPLHNCSYNVKRFGSPPTARISTLRSLLLSACGHYQR